MMFRKRKTQESTKQDERKYRKGNVQGQKHPNVNFIEICSQMRDDQIYSLLKILREELICKLQCGGGHCEYEIDTNQLIISVDVYMTHMDALLKVCGVDDNEIHYKAESLNSFDVPISVVQLDLSCYSKILNTLEKMTIEEIDTIIYEKSSENNMVI